MADSMSVDWKKMREKAGPYPPEAFVFVREGLAHTVGMVHGRENDADPSERYHVNGQQLCLGLRDYAIERYGMMARTVLGKWGIRGTEDFGRIVFAMIEMQLLRKSEEDSIEDFVSVYEFDEAFTQPELN